MKFTCGSCAAKYQIADEKIAGRTLKMKCRKCGHSIVVRGGSSAGAASPPEPPRRSRRPGLPPPPPAGAVAGASSVPPPPTRPSRSSGLGAEFRRQVGAAPAASPTPAAPGDEWHVAIDDVPVGPLSRDEVARRVLDGVIDEGSLVWREGFESWRALAEVAELASLLRARPAIHRPPTLSGRRGSTGRFGAARATGRGAGGSGLSPRPRASLPGPPPPPPVAAAAAARAPDPIEASFFPEPLEPEGPEPGHALHGHAAQPAHGLAAHGHPAHAGEATGSGHHGFGRASLTPLPSVPPPAPASVWQNPTFLLAALGVIVFAIGLVVVIGVKVLPGGQPVVVQSVPAPAEPARAASGAARVALPDDAELDRIRAERERAEAAAAEAARAAEEEEERARAAEDALAAPSAAEPAGGAPAARPAGDRADLSAEDRALLERMRGGDFGGPTVGARAIEDRSQSRAAGDLDERAVQRVVNGNQRALQVCWERAIRGIPQPPSVKYTFNLNVAPTGRVSRVGIDVSGTDLPGLHDCTEGMIRRWVFPPSAEGSPVSFAVNFGS